ncbi:ATPase, T2SS/T4P/T4SS family [Lachnospira multipara]|uniref:ATPase, T2SS/T4P/T4SS family n=1 Tax=Lachnospira multipara TaxID=28051 RepID=UPI000684756E|nr:ATPase, T2SS/T4P/T4SS family [Lachnospira multipara]
MINEELKEVLANRKNELFSELIDEINDEYITDIEWDGYNLWITKLGEGCKISSKKLSDRYVDNLSIKLANIMEVPFNRIHPILEANTKTLRISIWHESRSSKKSVAIRKIPEKLRFGHDSLIESNYISEELLNLLENSVIAHLSTVIGGQPHAGKTELLKYLSTFIPAYEKVGVYEDNQEIHYRKLNPNKKCVEFYVDNKVSYADIIRAGLRHNIDWILLSESRGDEVLDLLNSLSTGANCMTTMHLDDIRDMPDRMFNMLRNSGVSDRFINNIYKYIDLVVLVECDKYEKRKVTQVGFLNRDKNNECVVIYDNGEIINKNLPEKVKFKFLRYGITDPFKKYKRED